MQAIHDEWMKSKPEGALHEPSACPFCVESPTNGLEEGTFMSEDAAALLKAKDEEVARLSAQVAELLAQDNEQAVEARIADAVAGVETKVAELQAALDLQVLETEKAKSEFTTLVSALESVETERVAAEEQATRWTDRLAQIKEHASLMPDAHIEKNRDRWSAMPDEEFAALVDTFKVVGSTPAPGATAIPASTAMVASASREAGNPHALLAQVMHLRDKGIDVRSVR